MFRFLVDQMMDVDVVSRLVLEDYDAIRTSDVDLARASDSEVMNYAISHERILITMDEHFGDWIVLPLNLHPGVIRLKVNPTTTENILDV